MATAKKNKISEAEKTTLVSTLQKRFEKNAERHPNIRWADVQKKLEADNGKLSTLYLMEETGGEPDVIGKDEKTGKISFCDCSAESPKDRRSLCYDREALNKRKDNKPKNSAIDLANEMGASLLTEEEYFYLQTLGSFDTKTSSWLLTPAEMRNKGGAIFGDRRFDRVFIYHNGADSYYGGRGFRTIIKL